MVSTARIEKRGDVRQSDVGPTQRYAVNLRTMSRVTSRTVTGTVHVSADGTVYYARATKLGDALRMNGNGERPAIGDALRAAGASATRFVGV